MGTVFNICVFISMMVIIIYIIGMIKPDRIIPSNKIKSKRTFLTIVTIFLTAIIGGIESSYMVNESSQPNDISDSIAKGLKTAEYKTITISPQKMDSIAANMYSHTFDSLYNSLVELEHESFTGDKRRSLREQLMDLFDNRWSYAMEHFDSLGNKMPLCHKEFKRCKSKYNKIYAQYLVYGDADPDEIETWANYEGERILKKVVRDPKSLKIESVTCNGKVKKGWKCTIIYRATNGFGGYTREALRMIVAFDNEKLSYTCVDANVIY